MKSIRHIDFIIVGQGLAGSLLAWFLMKNRKKVLVLDYPHAGASSPWAAGIINPITGRRFAKSWRYESLFNFAESTWKTLEQELDTPLWYPRKIVRALHNNFEETEWLRRSAWPDHQAFMSDSPDLKEWEGKIRPAHAWGCITGGAQVDVPRMLTAFRRFLQNYDSFEIHDFQYNHLEISSEGVRYREYSASTLIFCEGAKAVGNPYFSYLPFAVTKGELLIIKIAGAHFRQILKHHLYIVPLGGDHYWAGSTSRFEFGHPFPEPEKRQWLESDLNKTLSIPYEVSAHRAALRPTVFDTRPFLGRHPLYSTLAIFNGLGTKGASQGPYFANQMANFLIYNSFLEKEVDISRWQKIFEASQQLPKSE